MTYQCLLPILNNFNLVDKQNQNTLEPAAQEQTNKQVAATPEFAKGICCLTTLSVRLICI